MWQKKIHLAMATTADIAPLSLVTSARYSPLFFVAFASDAGGVSADNAPSFLVASTCYSLLSPVAYTGDTSAGDTLLSPVASTRCFLLYLVASVSHMSVSNASDTSAGSTLLFLVTDVGFLSTVSDSGSLSTVSSSDSLFFMPPTISQVLFLSSTPFVHLVLLCFPSRFSILFYPS